MGLKSKIILLQKSAFKNLFGITFSAKKWKDRAKVF